ncbi:hypothetical protein RSOL_309400, partial [Rhizoctonia solani AG-3 Rhs1AP]
MQYIEQMKADKKLQEQYDKYGDLPNDREANGLPLGSGQYQKKNNLISPNDLDDDAGDVAWKKSQVAIVDDTSVLGKNLEIIDQKSQCSSLKTSEKALGKGKST